MLTIIRRFALISLLCAGQTACVKSNLDNAFDPASIPGMIIGLAISSGLGGGSSSGASSVDPSASVCSDVTPTIVEFATVGTTTYAVPATVKNVTIRAIGGGGSGGLGLATTGMLGTCVGWAGTAPNTAAGSSSVKIQGSGSNLIEALPGGYGGCGDDLGYVGPGGAGGAPGGSAGNSGNLTGTAASGGEIGTLFGAGGNGMVGGAGSSYGGGGGGSGAKVADTFSDLAGETLEITVGIGGAGIMVNPGTKGHVILILF